MMTSRNGVMLEGAAAAAALTTARERPSENADGSAADGGAGGSAAESSESGDGDSSPFPRKLLRILTRTELDAAIASQIRKEVLGLVCAGAALLLVARLVTGGRKG